jgi:hypothetical protein
MKNQTAQQLAVHTSDFTHKSAYDPEQIATHRTQPAKDECLEKHASA